VTDQPILAICDRCRAEGRAGEEPFAGLGELLDFEPVPRKPRADGWAPRLQRAFIAAVALTGSRKAAAEAVGKSESSVTHLLNSEGSESFRGALEAAQRIARREGRFGGSPDAPAGGPAWPTRRGGSLAGFSAHPEPGPDEAKAAQDATQDFLEVILRKHCLKVDQEREARLAGKIVEADYCLRQLTWLEVAFDVAAQGDGFAVLQRLRCEGRHLIEVAETPMSRVLGAARRRCWAERGEPDRPEHPPRRYLERHDGCSTEPTEFTRGGIELSHEEQWRRFDERHAADARAQIEWEARAAEQSAAWRARVEEARERGEAGGEPAG